MLGDTRNIQVQHEQRRYRESQAQLKLEKQTLRYRSVRGGAFPPCIDTMLYSKSPKTQYDCYVKYNGGAFLAAMTALGFGIDRDKAVDKWQRARPLSAAARLVRKVPLLGHRVVGQDPAADSGSPTNLRDAYAPMFAHRPDEWKQIPYGGETYTDEAFADQQLNGCQPYFIRRVEGDVAALQETIRATDADATAVAGRGTTLAGLIEQRRLFIIDTSPYFEGLWGHPDLKGVCNAVPVALFYIDTEKGRLMPLAIQLFAGAGRAGYANPLFTPRDDANVWLTAKLFVNNALACAHAAGQHLIHALASQVTGVAFRRCLPTGHPLGDLTYAFNDYAVAECSMLPVLMPPLPNWKVLLAKRHWAVYSMDALHVPSDVSDRGVEDIPHYNWRDAMAGHYEAFEALVQSVVDDAYATDADVARDPFLSDLADELHEEVNLRGSVINRTESGGFETKANVVRFFTAYCYYATPRFTYDIQQWPWYIWIPATPLKFDFTPMTTKEPIAFEQILEALNQPFSDAAIFQRASIMAVMRHGSFSRLTTGGPHGHREPPLPTWLTATPGQLAAREQFYVALAELEATMRGSDAERVKRGQRAFTALYPKKQFGSMWF